LFPRRNGIASFACDSGRSAEQQQLQQKHNTNKTKENEAWLPRAAAMAVAACTVAWRWAIILRPAGAVEAPNTGGAACVGQGMEG
jgi:hypothetical protein